MKLNLNRTLNVVVDVVFWMWWITMMVSMSFFPETLDMSDAIFTVLVTGYWVRHHIINHIDKKGK